MLGMVMQEKGTLINWNDEKGFGFVTDEKGTKISFVKEAKEKTSLFSSQLIIGCILFAAIILFTQFGFIPRFVLVTYIILSFISFFRYWSDKNSAKKSHFRTAESSLLLFDLLGGWFGGLLAQRLLRHKVSKQSYQKEFWAMVVVNLIGLSLSVYFGITEDFRIFI